MYVPRVFHITLVHSLIKTPKKTREIANALGLFKKQDNIIYISSPRMNKFFLKISHLIQVVPTKLLPNNVRLPSNVPSWVKKSKFIDAEVLKNDARFIDTESVNSHGYCDVSKVKFLEEKFPDLFIEHSKKYKK